MKNMSKFQKMLGEQFKPSNNDVQKNIWYDYASSTNSRGEVVVKTLEEFSPLNGKRLLDVGCGYGGVVVSAAKKGMNSVGIDYSQRLIEFSKANAEDNNLKKLTSFKRMDALDYQSFLRLGKFDFIVCDNVIEHVSQPEKLIALISLALKDDGTGYVTIPNAFSVNQILSDCHYGQKFLSLLSPLEGLKYVKELAGRDSYDVGYYYPLSFYKSLFQKYNLKPNFINPFQSEYERIVGVSRYNGQDLAKVLKKSLSEIKSTYQGFVRHNKVSEELLQILDSRCSYYFNGLEIDANFIEKEETSVQNLFDVFSHYYVELLYAIVKK